MDVNGNILLIRLRSIGDILFTRPAVNLVREAFPGAKITFLVSRESASLLEGFRDVDEVMTLDRALYRRGNPIAIVAETFSLLCRLRRGKFMLAVDFQRYGETALLTWWSGAPQRWGSVYGKGRRWAYTRSVAHNHRVHPAEWNLSFLHQCGLCPGMVRNEFALPDGALAEARQLFRVTGFDPIRTTLFIQPLTSTPHKNWPLDRYLGVARHWQRQGMQVLFGGGPRDRAALEPARQAGFMVSAGEPLLVTAGLMKLSSLILGGDTGVLHLAVAMGKRVVMILHSNDPGCCHPFRHPDWTVTPPAEQPVPAITTEAVIEACARAFAELGVSSRSGAPP